MAALAIIVTVLVAWLGVILLSPGEHAHHVEASGVEGTPGIGHDHSEQPGAVADRISAETPSVQFCVSASLEPFAGAVAQIREAGPAETAERFRRCLVDTMFDHAGDATLSQLETLRPSFSDCFAAVGRTAGGDKAAAVQSALTCVQRAAD